MSSALRFGDLTLNLALTGNVIPYLVKQEKISKFGEKWELLCLKLCKTNLYSLCYNLQQIFDKCVHRVR